MIYLDNHTSTEPSSRVVESLTKHAKELFYRPSAPYLSQKGFLKEIDQSFSALYELVGAEDADSIITLDSLASLSAFVFQKVAFHVAGETGKNFFAFPQIENASIMQAAKDCHPMGCQSLLLPVNEEGILTLDILQEHLHPKVAMLALSWVNPLTGVLQPMWEIAEYCKSRNILLYVEGSEGLAKFSFQLKHSPIDFFAFSGDLMHGPSGIAALCIKKASSLAHVLSRYRKGGLSEISNLSGLIGLGVAAQEMMQCVDAMSVEVAHLRTVFEDLLEEKIPLVEFISRKTKKVPNTTAFMIPGIHQELLAFLLYQKGVYLTYGGGRMQKMEYMLEAMHYDKKRAKSFVSASLSMHTSEEEIYQAVSVIEEIAKKYSSQGENI